MKKLIFLLGFTFIWLQIYATHNRAGEITYVQISSFTYQFTVTTYTNTKPSIDGVLPADRPFISIIWGDGTYSENVPRESIIELPDFIRKNTYIATHTFSGAGTFEIMVEDPNRNEGVSNIPNSVQTVFSIKTVLQINPSLGFNNAPILYNPPVDEAAVGKLFIHNPAAFDKDGDSISFEMTTCTGENGEPIPNYSFPASSNEPIYIDPTKGNLIWNTPVKAGTFNVAFNIFEWRQGVKIGRITRDMQIQVYNSNNTPPKFTKIKPICIEAGDSISVTVQATDNENEIITLTATGGIFNIDENIKFISSPTSGTATGHLHWRTKCEHIRKQPYNVIFKATDNNNEVNLVDQLSLNITVIAPPPKNLNLIPSTNYIELHWDSYSCANNSGFKIYRSTKSYNFIPDSCEIGVPEYTGFELISSINNPDTTMFVDNNNEQGLAQGFEYCYMITAVFDSDTESKASNEACGELIRGVPIITEVSVTEHSEANGEIYVEWSKPIDFDTVLYSGDLDYIVQRADGVWGSNYTNIDTLTNFDADTTYFDKNIDTKNTGYSYRVSIYSNGLPTEPPMTASSMFPQTLGKDKQIEINIQKNVPWINTSYSFFRRDPNSTTFNLIGTSNSPNFKDSVNLKNKLEYEYQVTSTGNYDLPGIKTPIINNSHRNIGIPIDTIPPNPPELDLDADCNLFTYHLNWKLKSPQDEIRLYRVYFMPSLNGELKLIDSVKPNTKLNYDYLAEEAPSGCFAITAVDSAYNESTFSQRRCVDNCSYYELPNVFTPNNDNKNDLFIPTTPTAVIDNFIDKIDLKIYSRWGNLVYETTNPRIEWDGKGKQTNKQLSSGVYYYVCEVYEKRISGIEHNTLVGFVHIFYGNKNLQPE